MRDPVLTDEFYNQQVQDAETYRERALEQIQEEIKSDPDERARLSMLWAKENEEGFLTWAAEKVLAEWTPAFDSGWMTEKELRSKEERRGCIRRKEFYGKDFEP